MKKRISIFLFVILLAIAFRLGRNQLFGYENELVKEWIPQIIFGFYFAIFTLAFLEIMKILPKKNLNYSRQALLLYMIIVLCLDMVLVNIQETVTEKDASYGLVVLWSTITFFVSLRTVELCNPKFSSKFKVSRIVLLFPLLQLGREILFLPYTPVYPIPWRAYLDLAFGNLPICLWLLLPLNKADTNHSKVKTRKFEQFFLLVAFNGCTYFFLVAIENFLFLFWPPSKIFLYHIIKDNGIDVAILNWAYLLIAVFFTFSCWKWNLFDVRNRFGMNTYSKK